MKTRTYKIPTIPQEAHTVIIGELLEIIKGQQEDIEMLKAELNRRKGLKNKPDIKPSTLDNDKNSPAGKGKKGKNNSGKKTKRPSKNMVLLHKYSNMLSYKALLRKYLIAKNNTE